MAILPSQDPNCPLWRSLCFSAFSIILQLNISLKHMFRSPSIKMIQHIQLIFGTPGSLGMSGCMTFSHW